MLKACKYCGRFHRHNEKCDKAPVYARHYTSNEMSRFRGSKAWRNKAEEIKRRDLQLCRVCLANLPGTIQIFNSELLEVHHIVPLKSSWNLRLENDNLITLCKGHHELAESGKISKRVLKELILLPPYFLKKIFKVLTMVQQRNLNKIFPI